MSFLQARPDFYLNSSAVSLGRSRRLDSIVEHSFRFTDELGPDDFADLVRRRLTDIEKQMTDFEGRPTSRRDAKAFSQEMRKRLTVVHESMAK